MASNQRRTDDLLRLKTRGLIYQNVDGSYPIADAVPYIVDASGTLGFSSVTIDPSGSMVVPGNLTVDGTTNINVQFQHLNLTGACPSIASTSTIALLPTSENVGINTCTPTASLDVSGNFSVADLFHVNRSVVDISGDSIGLPSTIASGINMNTDTVQLRLYAQNDPVVPGKREGTIGMAAPPPDGRWLAPTITFDVSSHRLNVVPWNAGAIPMTYDNSGNLSVGGTLTVGSAIQPNPTLIYTTPSINSIPIPAGVTTMTFEMIGAGGAAVFGPGGTGGYIKGYINVTPYTGKNLQVQVGGAGQPDSSIPPNMSASTASYITVTNAGTITGPLIAIAGAGGGGASEGTPQAGGSGGGGTFVASPDGLGSIAIGTNGQDGATGGGGQGGQVANGGSGGADKGFGGGVAGAGRPMPDNFIDATGGASNGSVSGGGGYTGGGSAVAGGGGGSSYINSAVTAVTSYQGTSVPQSLLSQYGRSGQDGYVSISFDTPQSNLLYVNSTATYSNLFTNPVQQNVFARYTTTGQAQPIAPGNGTASGTFISWGDTYNDGTLGSSAAPSNSVWTCNIPGVYIIALNIVGALNATGQGGIGLLHNGTLQYSEIAFANIAPTTATNSATYTLYLATGDTIIAAGLPTGLDITVYVNSTLIFTRIC